MQIERGESMMAYVRLTKADLTEIILWGLRDKDMQDEISVPWQEDEYSVFAKIANALEKARGDTPGVWKRNHPQMVAVQQVTPVIAEHPDCCKPVVQESPGKVK